MTVERLVVAYNFPPFNDGSAITMLKRILESGRAVDVISKDMAGLRQVDSSLTALIAPYVRHHDVVKGVASFAQWASVSDFAVQGINIVRARQTYESVYSRSMWPHSHYLAALIRIRDRARHWVAEFSDPLLWTAEGLRRPSPGVMVSSNLARELLGHMPAAGQDLLRERAGVLEWAQFVPMLIADQLVFTNEQQLEVMVGDLPATLRKGVRARSVVAPHPTLPREYYEASPIPRDASHRDTFRIGYFGNFYPSRGAGEFLEAWSSLPEAIAQSVSLDIYSESASLVDLVSRRVGLGERVHVRPTVPFLEFLSRTAAYDALLVTDVATSSFGLPSPFLPSKFSDYRGSDTPTMAVTLSGSPLDRQSAQWRARVGDVVSIREMLRAALEAKYPGR